MTHCWTKKVLGCWGVAVVSGKKQDPSCLVGIMMVPTNSRTMASDFQSLQEPTKRAACQEPQEQGMRPRLCLGCGDGVILAPHSKSCRPATCRRPEAKRPRFRDTVHRSGQGMGPETFSIYSLCPAPLTHLHSGPYGRHSMVFGVS